MFFFFFVVFLIKQNTQDWEGVAMLLLFLDFFLLCEINPKWVFAKQLNKRNYFFFIFQTRYPFWYTNNIFFTCFYSLILMFFFSSYLRIFCSSIITQILIKLKSVFLILVQKDQWVSSMIDIQFNYYPNMITDL